MIQLWESVLCKICINLLLAHGECHYDTIQSTRVYSNWSYCCLDECSLEHDVNDCKCLGKINPSSVKFKSPACDRMQRSSRCAISVSHINHNVALQTNRERNGHAGWRPLVSGRRMTEETLLHVKSIPYPVAISVIFWDWNDDWCISESVVKTLCLMMAPSSLIKNKMAVVNMIIRQL